MYFPGQEDGARNQLLEPQRDDVDLVQQPEYDLFSYSGAVSIKGFKVSFVTEGARGGVGLSCWGRALKEAEDWRLKCYCLIMGRNLERV